MGNIVLYIMIGFMFICGGLSSIYVAVAMPGVIIWKIYRKIVHGEKMM